MWPFKKKSSTPSETPDPYNGCPPYLIRPAPHGKWELLVRNISPSRYHLAFVLFSKAFYDSEEEAKADIVHLGLDKEP